jgi:hypothetical protein
MSDKNSNSAAEAVAELTKASNEVLEVQTSVNEDATEKTALDEVAIPVKTENAKKEKVVKIKILLPVAGKFLLPYNVGQIVKLSENQANEIVEAKYAEFVK